jgi:methionyl-tRNA formyltransferase
MNMSSPAVVIATPHSRHDLLEANVRKLLPCHHVVRLREKKDLSLETLNLIKPGLVFFPHWSWLIPEEIHSRFECIIFHMTDVPYGRGGSPLQNLIVRGHERTMLSAIKCVRELDAGPVYMKRPLSLTGTAEEILQRASALIEPMIVEIVQRRPTPIPQQGEVVEFKRRRPSDGDLAPLADLQQVYDYIRMLDAEGYPSAFLLTQHFKVEFRQAQQRGDSIEATVRIKKVLHE